MNNTKTLEQLVNGVTKEEKDKAIDEFTNLLSKVTKRLYKSYQVLRLDPQTKEQRLYPHRLIFQSHISDELTSEEHNKMFKLAFDNNLTVFEINPVFRNKVKDGKVLELGNAVVTETSLGNILEGNTLSFSIEFMSKDNYEEKKQKEKEAEKRLKEQRNNE